VVLCVHGIFNTSIISEPYSTRGLRQLSPSPNRRVDLDYYNVSGYLGHGPIPLLIQQ
jgi:hypothetical protein